MKVMNENENTIKVRNSPGSLNDNIFLPNTPQKLRCKLQQKLPRVLNILRYMDKKL
jgi:hypothetical protein